MSQDILDDEQYNMMQGGDHMMGDGGDIFEDNKMFLDDNHSKPIKKKKKLGRKKKKNKLLKGEQFDEAIKNEIFRLNLLSIPCIRFVTEKACHAHIYTLLPQTIIHCINNCVSARVEKVC